MLTALQTIFAFIQTISIIMLTISTIILINNMPKNDNSTRKTAKADKNTKLKPAKEMYLESIKPQMKSIMNDIQRAKDQGKTYTRVDDFDTIASENIDILLALKYDIHMMYYHSLKSLSMTVHFNKNATGIITYEDAETKKMLNYHGSKKGSHDIIKHSFI